MGAIGCADTVSMNDYSRKITAMMDQMENNSIACFLPAAPKVRNRDVHFGYRQHSDILYLTGLSEPGVIWVFETRTSRHQIHVFMEKQNPLKIRWEGRMLTPESVVKQLPGLRIKIHEHENPATAFRNVVLQKLMQTKNVLYVPFDMFQDQHEITMTDFILAINAAKREARAGANPPASIVDMSAILHEMRLVKSDQELSKIKSAIDITALAFYDAMKASGASFTGRSLLPLLPLTNKMKNTAPQSGGSPALFEFELKARIENAFLANGAGSLAYPTIVGSGPNATVLHYQGDRRKIEAHDLVLIDAGCEWQGYAADVTRTFPAGGRFTGPSKQMYEIVLQAQKAGLELCRPGSTLDAIHEAVVRSLTQDLWKLGLFKKIPPLPDVAQAQKPAGKKGARKWVSPKSVDEVIKKKYYRHYYMHFTSHFLGLDVHDPGKYYTNRKSRELVPGMVFTVEPGLYFPPEYDFINAKYRGIGIRIEDDIVITRQGCEILTSHIPKETKDIENLMTATKA